MALICHFSMEPKLSPVSFKAKADFPRAATCGSIDQFSVRKNFFVWMLTSLALEDSTTADKFVFGRFATNVLYHLI